MSTKILFIITRSEFGGAQRYLYEIATRLDPQKYEIVFGIGEKKRQSSIFDFHTVKSAKSGAASPHFNGVKFSNIRTFYLKHLKRVPWLISALLCVREILSLLKREKPDVLFLCSTTSGILGSVAGYLHKKKNPRLKIIYRIGGWAFRDPRPTWQNKIIIRLEKLTAPVKDKIIVNSEIDRQLAVRYKITPENKILKIYNGVDPDKMKFLPRNEAREYLSSKFKIQSHKIIGTIANFYKTKGLNYLIEAAHVLTAQDPILNISFVIIGEGRERPKLKGLIKKYGLENIVFLAGRLADAYQYLKAFDVFVLPSVKEGFPWAILEAMAAEVPVIAAKVGALPEIIEDSKEGLLIEPKNSRLLAEKINWLLSHPEQARQMASLAKEKAQTRFPLQKMLSDTQLVLNA